MRKLFIILTILAMALTACTKGPYPATQEEICKAIDLEPTCEEWIDYCFLKYYVWDKEDKEFVKVLESCD